MNVFIIEEVCMWWMLIAINYSNLDQFFSFFNIKFYSISFEMELFEIIFAFVYSCKDECWILMKQIQFNYELKFLIHNIFNIIVVAQWNVSTIKMDELSSILYVIMHPFMKFHELTLLWT